ncbi:MAG: hypothetical protein WC679_02095 [Bacteroidales bacterium]|jgi:hypothetical protein
MEKVSITKINELYVRVDSSDRGVLLELSEKFSFYVDGYKYTPKYKQGIWDGKIRLFDVNKRTFPFGLLFELLKFCKVNNYEIELTNKEAFRRENFDDDLIEFTNNIKNISNKSVEGKYSYQYDALKTCIVNNKALVLSPTSCLDPETTITVKLSQEAIEFIKNHRNNKDN